LFLGVELVRDRSTKAPFDPRLKLHAKIRAQAMENGLMAYPMGGTIDGHLGDHILLAPPFIVTENDVAEIVDLLARSVEQTLQKMEQA
jgi:adenosylmethionine-8-amino-7-oxononanoate aminotransferase